MAQSNKRSRSNRGDVTKELGEIEDESERLAEQLKHKVNMSRYTKDKKEKVFIILNIFKLIPLGPKFSGINWEFKYYVETRAIRQLGIEI